jgi:TRAP transporter TAXI family solute receptor
VTFSYSYFRDTYYLKGLIVLNGYYKLISIGLLSSSIYASEFITIGTGGVTGTYYPTGSNICKYVNIYKTHTNIRCSVEATGGSIYNLDKMNNNELDFGIVQSDTLYQMNNNIIKLNNDNTTEFRSVMAIYPELFTLVSRKDSHINSYHDLKNKRINLGNKGSGNESTALEFFKAIGLKIKDLKFAGSLKSAEMPDALIENKIDAYFYMVGHPTQNIKDAANSVDIKLISLNDTKVKKFVNSNPYYTLANIPANLYKGNSQTVSTFAVKAVLVTTTKISDKIVYSMIKSIFENFDNFKKEHPSYFNITKESLLKGLSVPLHNGAIKYYKEVGLLP